MILKDLQYNETTELKSIDIIMVIKRYFNINLLLI